MHHNLKSHPSQFQPIFDGRQKSMNRINDRKYAVGDTWTLNEGEGTLAGFQYTGRTVSGVISHMDIFGCQPGYVNLSLDKVGMLIVKDKNDGSI